MNSPPPRSALIVVDMVNDYFDADLWPGSILPASRDALVAGINRLVGACRAHHIPIFWVRQAFKPDLSDAFQHMRAAHRAYTIANTPGARLLPDLDHRPTDRVLVKSRFSAFFNTDLHDRLQEAGCRHVLLAGITTAWCIRSTATDAYQHDYGVTLVADCMQGFSASDHDRALAAMDGYIATTITSHDLAVRPTRPASP